MNPNAEETYRVLGLTLGLDGAYDEAVRVLEEALLLPESGTYTQATLGYVLARMGRESESRDILASLEAHAKREYVSPVAFATILIGLGEIDGALDWAERARADRRGWLAYLKVNPLMDPLRGHRRFDALVRDMGL